MNEYRCTRNQPYLNPNCFGSTDLEARSGYYLKAENEQGAITQMKEQFPLDTAGFTAHLFKIDCPVCRGRGVVMISHCFDNPRSKKRALCDLCEGKRQVELIEAKEYYARI